MATKRDYCDSYAQDQAIQGNTWGAQQITPSSTYKLNSVKLYIRKQGSGSSGANVVVHITATDGNGHPTGGDLVSKAITISDISTNYNWVEFVFASPITVNQGTTYTIVFEWSQQDCGLYIDWGYEPYHYGGDYSGGVALLSTDGGSNWNDTWGGTGAGNTDWTFECWGSPLFNVAVAAHHLKMLETA